ncbi:hypothetical protein FQN49_006491 [Arthroderma sp. PD_2]|nr:hypothetical protein FQN49_006491 [Arthroderma sp. PD_2]
MGSGLESEGQSKSLPLLRGTITLESALADDDDILLKLSYPEQRIDFFTYLYSRRHEIENIVAYHLGLRAVECKVGEVKEWIAGSFNVCLPVYIDKHAAYPRRRVMIRFPLPYKIGESRFPGNADEKVRCEAATFIWLQERCPNTVPIPQLWGFGFPNGQSFTIPENMHILTRLVSWLHRTALTLFGQHTPSNYIGHTCPNKLGLGYLVMDYVEGSDGTMLSESWGSLFHDPVRRANLFGDLAQILLAMSQFPLPRIGSLTIDDRGLISLTNRPLTLQIQQLENEGIHTGIPRNGTYSSSETYILDSIRCHDNRLRGKANSIRDEYDGRAQMAASAAMRALCPHFLKLDRRHRHFMFTLTDIHQSNIFVDADWHIKCIVDLEWACSLPVEMLHPPTWLTNRAIDLLEAGEHLEAYTRAQKEFLDIFEEKERLFPAINEKTSYRTDIMRANWQTGGFWYFQALATYKGFYNLYIQHLQPRLGITPDRLGMFDELVAPYWAPDATEVLATKIRDKEAYDKQLRHIFAGEDGDA